MRGKRPETRIKICGNTSLADAKLAISLGADALGFIFAPSPRHIEPPAAKWIIEKLPPFVTKVGVFVDEDPIRMNHIANFCGLDAIQLHGNESPEVCARLSRPVIKVFRIHGKTIPRYFPKYESNISAIMLDTFSKKVWGGTGKVFPWKIAKKIGQMVRRPLILAGGLTPQNVAHAIEIVHPFAVDVVSSVEKRPGKKDPQKLRAFFEAVRDGQ